MAPREPLAQLAEPCSTLRGWAASRYFQTGSYDAAQLQAIADKLDELMDALKRA